MSERARPSDRLLPGAAQFERGPHSRHSILGLHTEWCRRNFPVRPVRSSIRVRTIRGACKTVEYRFSAGDGILLEHGSMTIRASELSCAIQVADRSRISLVIGFDPPGAPPKRCSAVSVPMMSSLKTIPQPPE